MQSNYEQKPPNIAHSLSRAFSQKQNTLVIHTKGLDICRGMAEALYQQKQHMVIMIDFEPSQIQQINFYLHEIKQEKVLHNRDNRADKPQVLMLNKTVRQKRRRAYINGGIYGLTTQIMLLDCLSNSQDLNPQCVTRLIIRDEDSQILDKYSLICWLCTIVSLDSNKTIINVISKRATHYKGQNLQKIMRLLYMKKLVVWPFGRSQIHQSINIRSLSNTNIKLNMDVAQEQVHKCYDQLLKYSKKNQWDSEQINKICYNWLNCNKLDHLNILNNLLQNSSDYSIWKSNNTNIIQLIDKILQISKNCIYSLLLIQPNKNNQVINQSYMSYQSQYNSNNNNNNKYRIIDLVKLISSSNNTIINKVQNNIQGTKSNDNLSKNKQSSSCSSHTVVSNKIDEQTNDLPKLAVNYTLQYQMHVTGLADPDSCSPAIYPIKFISFIKQLNNYLSTLQYLQINQQQQADIRFVLSLKSQSKSKQNQHIIKDQNEHNQTENKGNQTNKQQQNQRIVLDNNQDIHNSKKQKQIHKQLDISKQDQQPDQQNVDLSKYEFNKINDKKTTQVFSQSVTLTRESQTKQPKLSQTQKMQEIQTKSMPIRISQVGSLLKQQQPKPKRRSASNKFKIADTFIQQTVYLCTYSEETNKQLHKYIHIYQHKQHYIQYIRELYKYLDANRHTRISQIMRIIKKLTNPNGNKSANKGMLIHEHEPILLQELYLELKSVIQIIDQYSLSRKDVVNRNSNFAKELNRIQCKYVDKYSIRLAEADYHVDQDCLLTLQTKNGTDVKFRFYFRSNKSTAQLNQYLRVLVPHLVCFYSPNASLIRHININYSQQLLLGIKKVYAIYFKDSLQSLNAIKIVKDQDQAFWNIGQERKKLGVYSENAQVRIQQLFMDDQIQKKARMISMAAATTQSKSNPLTNPIKHINKIQTQLVQRTILIDKRQFKSLLPSYLFHFGFRVVPIFLQTADYIISNDIVVQKKSVHTRDLHQSLRSGRLFEQAKRMCSKFAKPYLLIQCPDLSYFKKDEFSFSYNTVTGDKYSFNVRKQLIKIISKFPKLNIIWSTNYMQTVKFFMELKKNQQQPDLTKFQPQSEQNQLQILEQSNQKKRTRQTQQVVLQS